MSTVRANLGFTNFFKSLAISIVHLRLDLRSRCVLNAIPAPESSPALALGRIAGRIGRNLGRKPQSNGHR